MDGYQSVPERHGKGYGGRRGQPPLMSWLLSVIYIVYGTVVLITVECNILQDVYETFNILMRRKPKENNFKVSFYA